MELISLNDNLILDNVIACIGEFDGLHLGHMALVNQCVKLAKDNKCKSALIAFYPHPDYVLNKRENVGYLTTIKEKEELLKKANVDYLILIDFNEKIANLSYDEFYDKYLSKFKGLVLGYDFRFGYKGLGNSNYLKEKYHNKIISVIDKQTYNNEKISSEIIRKLIKEDNYDLVTKLLGRFYSIEGKVIKGNNIGSSIGFPTANIEIDKEKLLINDGVYIVNAIIDNKEYIGMANFGNNPSINLLDHKSLEVYVIDEELDLYNKNIKVEFIKKIRNEIKFNSKSELINQMNKDKEETLSYFNNKNN